MPITKSYLNKKVVSSLKRMASSRGINPKQTKPKLVDAILKHEAKQKKLSKRDAPSKGIYATKKSYHAQHFYMYIIAYKFNKPGSKTTLTVAAERKYKQFIKSFQDRNFKKVPFANVVLKK